MRLTLTIPAIAWLVSLTLLLSSCTPKELLDEETFGAGTDAAPSSTDVAGGEVLYDTYCLSCHGSEGGGGAVWEGSIQGYSPIHDVVVEGRGSMPPIALEPAQVDQIQDYLDSFGVELSALSGAELYQAQCASCHGSRGEGTFDGPIIQFAHADYASWVIRNGRDGAGYASEMPSYPESRLTNRQLTEILEFLHDNDRPVAGEDLYTTFCSHCHGGKGGGGTTGKGIGGHAEVDEVIRVGKGGTAYGSRILYMPGWGGRISATEIQAISQYVGSLPEP